MDDFKDSASAERFKTKGCERPLHEHVGLRIQSAEFSGFESGDCLRLINEGALRSGMSE